MIYYFQMFNLVYLSFVYKVLQDLQETLEMEIYSQNKNELKVQNLEEKGKRSVGLLKMNKKQIFHRKFGRFGEEGLRLIHTLHR